MTDIRNAAARWACTWTEAWEALDVEPIIALYAPDVTFSTEPFREAYRGHDGVRAYVTRASPEEESPRVCVSEPIVDGDWPIFPFVNQEPEPSTHARAMTRLQ